MAETDLKIKDAPLSTNISGNARMAGSDGSGLPVAISMLQVYNFVNSTLKSDGYFAPKTDIPSKVSQLVNDSKFVSSDITDALAKSVAQNANDIEWMIEYKDHLGDVTAISLDTEKWPTITGIPIMRIGSGTPSMIPDFIGQKYVDTTNKKLYFAFGVDSISNWGVLN